MALDPDPEVDASAKRRSDDGEVALPGMSQALFVHMWLDALDTMSKWYEAQVIEISNDRLRVKIHYKGWKSKFDEWLNITEHKERLAALHSHTVPRESHGDVCLEVGKQYDCLDTQDKWYIAEVVEESSRDQVKIHYLSWSDRYDEWLNKDSYRLAPLHTFTSRPTTPVTRASRTSNHSALSQSLTHAPNSAALDRRRPSRARHAHYSRPTSIRMPVSARAPIVTTLPSRIRPSSAYLATAENEDEFRRVLKCDKGMEIVDMANDGNCLFRSISHQVYGNPEVHGLVRRKCVEYMRKESHFFRNYVAGDWEEYLRRMLEDGVWGDNVEIQAMSEIYDRPVEIYAYQSNPMKTYSRPNSQRPKASIRLSYHFQSHYNSIVDPLSHHRHTERKRPGEIEDAMIRFSSLRTQTALSQAIQVSDLRQTEVIQLQKALESSREDFQSSSGTSLDKAIAESLQEYEKISLAKLSDDVDTAKQQSAQEQEEQEIKKVIEQSERADLQRAISASLDAFRETVGDTRDEEKLPSPIEHCHKTLGFPLEDCVAAFSIYGTTPNVPHDTVVGNMLNHILAQKESSR